MAELQETMMVGIEAKNTRQQTCLNGIWTIEVDGESGVFDLRVPGSFAGQYKLWGKEHWNTWDYPEAWFDRKAVCRKTVMVPEDCAKQRVLIRFNGVRHMVRVCVNGAEAGTWSDSYVPFVFDITDLVSPGENELAVHIGAETTCGLFEDYNTSRRGIYRDVFLQLVPEVRIDDDLCVQTHLRERKLCCSLALRNDSATARSVRLRFRVADPDGTTVKHWEPEDTHALPPGGLVPLEISEPWAAPHLWSIDDPFLYHLHTELVDAASGERIDHHRQRFGFREITWGNAKLYLNGEELYLRANGNHPMGDLEGGKPFAEAMIRHLKAYGVQAMRMHDLARHQEMYEAGDELGFLFIAEAAHHFRLPPEEVGKAHMRRLIRYLRNHPSVMAWSVSNELHWRNFEEPAYLIELCRELDPTRPAFASDFTAWSLHGDVVAHHYSPETMWDQWLEYGKDKAMIWDELGGVWQHDRDLDTGPAGYEIYSQDVATGIYRDGMEIVRNLEIFADGKVVDGDLRRVSLYAPWEFGYNFFRFQPFNNLQKMPQTYDQIEGTRGIKIDSVMPGASTTNIWDPTLPTWQPNPALYCFKDDLECVRFPDDPQERSWFGDNEISVTGRMFYETHTAADAVAFRVETPGGEVLTETIRPVDLRPGTYVAAFASAWQLPVAESATPARLVRQFSLRGQSVYRQARDIKIFPRHQRQDLLADDVAVLGSRLQAFFGGAGADLATAKIVLADEMSDALQERVRGGARVLTIADGSARPPAMATVALDASMDEPGQQFVYRLPQPMPLDAESWIKVTNHQTTKVSGAKFPDKLWWEERELWKSSPASYQPQFRILLRSSSGEVFATGDATPLTLSRVQCAPPESTEKFLLRYLDWSNEAGERVMLDELPLIAEVVLVQTRQSGPEVTGRLRDLQIVGATAPGAVFPTNGAPAAFLRDLGDEDLACWRGGSATASLQLPSQRASRRFLFGNKHGRGSSLHEWYLGAGVALETSLNLCDSFDEEPVAGELLARCLARLRSFAPAPAVAPVAILGDDALLACYAKLGIDCERRNQPEDLCRRPLVVAAATTAADAARLAAWQAELRAAVSAGVTVLFTPLTEASIEVVRQITGRAELALTEPFFGETTYCIKAPVSWARVNTPETLADYYSGILAPYPFEPNASPLLSGLANIDLNWGGAEMFSQGIELAGMDPVAASAAYNILISNWHINSEPGKSIFGEMLNGVRDLRQNTWFVNRDPVVFQLHAGAGSFVFNQLQLAAAPALAARVMTLLLTQLRAPFCGTPVPKDVYDLSPQADQLARFAEFAGQIQPGRRQYYGVPNPMPPFLKETRIGQELPDELPLLGFIGDELALQLAHPLGEALSDILRTAQPVRIDGMADAVSQFSEQAADAEWDRVVLSVGNGEDLSPEHFAESLRALYQAVRPNAQQFFWLPLAPSPEPGRQARIQACNQAAEAALAGEEIYMTPFVYDNAEQILRDFHRTGGRAFTGDEVHTLTSSLSEAVRSFGAM